MVGHAVGYPTDIMKALVGSMQVLICIAVLTFGVIFYLLWAPNQRDMTLMLRRPCHLILPYQNLAVLSKTFVTLDAQLEPNPDVHLFILSRLKQSPIISSEAFLYATTWLHLYPSPWPQFVTHRAGPDSQLQEDGCP